MDDDKWPGREGTLRQLVKSGLTDVREAIARLCVIIGEMDKSKSTDFKLIELELLGLQESLEELEERLVSLERHKNLAQFIARELLLVLVVVVVVVWIMTEVNR